MSDAILNFNEKDENLIVLMPVKVDITNSHSILTEIVNYINADKVKKVIFDMKDCDFISSAGIGLMANIAKQSKDKSIKTCVKNCNDSIKEVLTITDIINYIGIE
jgi:anti-anti-sigma factor